MQKLFYQSGSIKLPKKAHMQVPFMGKGLYSGTFFPLAAGNHKSIPFPGRRNGFPFS